MYPSYHEIGRLLHLCQGRVLQAFTPPASFGLPSSPAERQAELERELARQVSRCRPGRASAPVATQVCGTVEHLQERVDEDVQAALRNDPAARSRSEVEACYPGIHAAAAYRFAHESWKLDVPILPRMLTEYAHSRTGIDIHPGAQIGRAFFIDHGTGVVIGETCRIGDRVLLYQGVTLGATRFPRDASGQVLRVADRHPLIQDDVVIYANATILGGDTVIGAGSVIGAGVWLTSSVDPGTVVLQSPPRQRHLYRNDQQSPATRNAEQ